MESVAIVAAVLPALVIVAYFVVAAGIRLDADLVWAGFGFGAFAAFPTVVFAEFLTTVVGSGVGFYEVIANKAFIRAAVPEEIVKLVALLALCWGRLRALRPNHLFAISVATAGGFACLENILYVLMDEEWHMTALARSISAVPGHAFVGAIMGLCVARAVRSSFAVLWWGSALLLPIALHGTYDFFVFGYVEIGAGDAGVPRDLIQVFVFLFVLTVLIEGGLAHISLRGVLGMEESRAGSIGDEVPPARAVRWFLSLSESPTWWGIAGGLCLICAAVLSLPPIFGLVEGHETPDEVLHAILFGFAAFFVLHGIAFVGLAYTILRRSAFEIFARPF